MDQEEKYLWKKEELYGLCCENSNESPETTEEIMDFVLSVGEFLVLRGTDGHPLIFSVDLRWKGGSMTFANVSRDEKDKGVTAEHSLYSNPRSTCYQM